ncbi:DUF6683 family protein [uncultured Sphingomonas sp.]|uniref:DUF6683 family protein n=1 Tax=uncultured Sphingomonas sp. TaxID=158754 RepID=UPI0025D674C7|nr:DUF6683 family protein [uncultured Sphingomonas sp.]
MKAGLAAIMTVLVASAPAKAQEWFAPGYFDNWAFNNHAAEVLRRSHKQIFGEDVEETLRSRHPAEKSAPPAPIIAGDAVQRIARQLSNSFPAGDRDKARRMFVDLYGKYGQLERQLRVRPGDPAGATAALIAASYMAFADADLGDAAFRSLYAQLRAPVAAVQVDASAAEAHVTMAILATYLAAMREALKAHPDPTRSAALRNAGGNYLRALLGVDPERVRLGPKGLDLL